MPAKFRILGTGEATTETDPNRGIWYSAGGTCGYWTDDWSKLSTHGKHGIPCCPECGAVGMETNYGDWSGGAVKHEEAGNPRYAEFCEAEKERCDRKVLRRPWMTRYRDFVSQNGNK